MFKIERKVNDKITLILVLAYIILLVWIGSSLTIKLIIYFCIVSIVSGVFLYTQKSGFSIFIPFSFIFFVLKYRPKKYNLIFGGYYEGETAKFVGGFHIAIGLGTLLILLLVVIQGILF